MQQLITEGHLKPHPFMDGAGPVFLNYLEEFSTEQSFAPGEIIFRQGEYADRMFLILGGSVALEAEDQGITVARVETLGPGDVLGWSWLFPPVEWHFTARALAPCDMIVLSGASLLIRARENAEFGCELLRRVSGQVVHRLQSTRERLLQEIRAGSRPLNQK